MTDDLAAKCEQAIRAHRPLDLGVEWADEMIFPVYNGLSIRNLPHTVVRLLDHRWHNGRLGSSPLDGRLWTRFGDRVRRVVLFISDGLGWLTLRQIMADDPATAQVVADLTGDGTFTPITSIAPSTTAAALPCLWTGAAPVGTGMVGTRVFLREFSTMVNMLHYTPHQAGQMRHDSLEDWGFDFETFVPLETLGEALHHRRIPTTVLLDKNLFNSGLSRIMHRGVSTHARHVAYNDLWIVLRDLLRETRGARCFVNIYWSAVDSISHMHGTTSEHAVTEIRRQLRDLRDTLLADGVADGRTVVLFAADHGHTPTHDHILAADHPPLTEALRCGLGGETRFAYAYLRHDFRPQVIDYVRERLGDRLAAVHPADALAAGLFGPDAPHPEAAARLGDLMLIARGPAGLVVKQPGPRTPVSRHGSLTEREMLVPLIVRAL